MTTNQILDYMDGYEFYSESFGFIKISNVYIYDQFDKYLIEIGDEDVQSLYVEYFTTHMYPEISAFN